MALISKVWLGIKAKATAVVSGHYNTSLRTTQGLLNHHDNIAPFKSNHLAEWMLRQLHCNSHCRGDAILSKRIAIFWANKGKCLRYHGFLWQGTSALERCGCSKKACVQKKCDVGLSLFLVKLEPPFRGKRYCIANHCGLRVASSDHARIGRGALEWRLHDFCCHAGSPWSQKSPVCVCVYNFTS